MLQHSEASGNKEKLTQCSLKNRILSISRFLLTTQIQCLSGLIEYVVVTCRKGAYEFVCPNEVLPNCIFERLNAIPANCCTVIETILLHDSSSHHKDRQLPLTVLERWVLQPVQKSPPGTHSTVASIERTCDEIRRYWATSPLVHWLKGQKSDRERLKFTHRICTIREASPHLGLSFRMDRSELTDVFTFYDSDNDSYSPACPVTLKEAHNPSSIPGEQCPFPAPKRQIPSDGVPVDGLEASTIASSTITTPFSPIHVDTDRMLHVSVTIPQHLPSSDDGANAARKPFCAVCGVRSQPAGTTDERYTVSKAFHASASTSSMSSSFSSGASSASLNSQTDGAYGGTARVDLTSPLDAWHCTNPTGDRTSSRLHLSALPGESDSQYPYTKTVKSPMVVMTDVRHNFFPTDEWPNSSTKSAYYHHMSGPELDLSGSGSSTLTKKSRGSSAVVSLSTNNTAASTTPPSSLSFSELTDKPLESPPRKQQRMVSATADRFNSSPIADQTKKGTMDNVIDKFTLLNVQRDELNGFYVPGSNPPAVEQATDSAPATNPIEEPSSVVQPDLSATPKPTSDPGPRSSRRRNASSICVGAWPSWNRDAVPFFNRRTGLPLQSSPVPLKRSTSGKFDFDASLCPLKQSKSSTCMAYGTESRTDVSPASPLTISKDVTLAPTIQPTTDQNSLSDKVDCSSAVTSVTTMTTANSQTVTAPSQPRRRPASLRLNMPPPPSASSSSSSPLPANGATESGGRHPARRRACPPPASDHYYHHHHHPTEMSCSAPPSGNRSLHLVTDRLANTMACTPVSHASSQHLLVNFEESMLNGRIHPVGQVDGFTLELGASGAFFPAHARIPMQAYFFDLSDDNAPSPYLGYADLSHLRNGKGYHVPKKGSVQLTLFNPNKFVVKMFVIGYDFEDMPPNSQTFLRQRTVYMPIDRSERGPMEPTNPDSTTTCQSQTGRVSTRQTNHDTKLETSSPSSVNGHPVPQLFWAEHGSNGSATVTDCSSDLSSACSCSSLRSTASSTCSLASGLHDQHDAASLGQVGRSEAQHQPAFLRYLVHLRFHTTRSGRLYLHTDLRLIFARDKFEFDPRVATYELRSFVDAPSNPRYSPKKWTKPRVTRGTVVNTTGSYVPHISTP